MNKVFGAKALKAWIGQEDIATPRIVEALVRWGPGPLQELVLSHRGIFTLSLVTRLLERAHSLLGAEPRRSVSLSRLGIWITVAIHTDSLDETAKVLGVLGDAWREHALALTEVGEFRAGMDAVEQADLYYFTLAEEPPAAGTPPFAEPPPYEFERTLLNLVRGRLQFELGRQEEALVTIAQAAALLNAFWEDKRRYVQAITLRAAFLTTMGRFSDAMDVFESCAAMAREENDKETLAYLVWNIGHCYAGIGRPDEGKTCFETAMELFTFLGAKSEVVRVRGALVSILTQQGRYAEAIFELYNCRAEFMALNMPLVAAQVSLDIVNLLFLSDRTAGIPSLCAETIRTFQAARLPREAMKALAYMNALATAKSLTRDDVVYVRAFMGQLESSPCERFERASRE